MSNKFYCKKHPKERADSPELLIGHYITEHTKEGYPLVEHRGGRLVEVDGQLTKEVDENTVRE